MGDFKKFGKKGDTWNRGPGGKPSFASRPGFNRGGDERREMFKATCAECGRATEVPFRPSGERPVYCKDCFAAMRPQDRDERPFVKRDAPRRDFSSPRDGGPRPSFAPRPFSPAPQRAPGQSFTGQGSGEDKRLDDIKIQLATVISKLDKLVNIMGNGNTAHTTPKAAPAKSETLHDTLAKVAPAVVSKTETKKSKSSAASAPAAKKKAASKKK